MKKVYAFLFAFMLFGSLLAQAPQSFNYQAVVRNIDGSAIENTQVGMRISILQGSVTGTSVCIEEFTPTTNAFGLVTLAVGSVNTTDFTAIDWSKGPYFIKIELLVPGKVTYSEMGTSQLLSVPYALYADSIPDGSVTSAKLADGKVPYALYAENAGTIGTNGTYLKDAIEMTGTAVNQNSMTLNLPNGYTPKNTRVLSVELYSSEGNIFTTFTQWYYGLGYVSTNGNIDYFLFSEETTLPMGQNVYQIRIRYPDELQGLEYRILLIKVTVP